MPLPSFQKNIRFVSLQRKIAKLEMSAPAKSTPRDAQIMGSILKDMGVSDYEPRLINQMLEFVYSTSCDILEF